MKQSATDALKTASKRAIFKKVEATGDLLGNINADEITSVPKKRKYKRRNEEGILIERYMCPELRQKIIDELRIII